MKNVAMPLKTATHSMTGKTFRCIAGSSLIMASSKNPKDFGIKIILRSELVGQELHLKMTIIEEKDRKVCSVHYTLTNTA